MVSSVLPAPAHTPRPASPDRLLIFVFAAGLTWLLWTAACVAPLGSWNPPRLASSFALAAGQSLYPDPDSGAQLGWFYGPGFAVWQLPVTLISSPSWALSVACLWNGLGILAAVAWVFHGAGCRGSMLAQATGLTGMLLFAGGLVSQNWILWVHVDAPCLSFALVTIGAAIRFDLTGHSRWLHLAALAAVATCLTKQSAATLPMALTLGWLARRHWKAAGRWIWWAGCYGALSLAVLLYFYSPRNVWFYTIESHRLNSWRAGANLGEVLLALLLDLTPWGALLGLLLLFRWRQPAPATAGRSFRVAAGWLGWLGLAQLPLGLTAAMKTGGGLNSVHALMPLLLLLVLGTIHTPFPRAVMRAIGVLLTGFALVNASDRLHQAWPSSYQDELLAVAERHRNEIYLPWNPLITLLTDGRVYPFEDALQCLKNIHGRPPTPARIRSALPPQPMVVYDSIAATRDVDRFIPELKPVSLYDLEPGMLRYRR